MNAVTTSQIEQEKEQGGKRHVPVEHDSRRDQAGCPHEGSDKHVQHPVEGVGIPLGAGKKAEDESADQSKKRDLRNQLDR